MAGSSGNAGIIRSSTPWAGDAEVTARFRDPGGNIIGLYQEPVKSGTISR
jgi:hypothetical protein